MFRKDSNFNFDNKFIDLSTINYKNVALKNKILKWYKLVLDDL